MEVKTTGTMTPNNVFTNAQASKGQRAETTQGSVEEETLKRREDVKEKPWKEEGLTSQIDAMNELVDMRFTSIQFERHDTLDRTIVRVIDRDTDEVIKEIPPQEFLDMISSMLEFAGIIVDKKV